MFLVVQLLSGLANAMVLFLIASGLSLIFGVTRIVNFAHGSFYMLAAFPTYDLAMIAVGPAVALALWLVFYRTRWGILIRAATQDREMVAALGVDQSRLFTGVFVLGSFLAGLAGALQVPRVPLTTVMDTTVIVEAFVVVVIGGMGSVWGALLASLLIGVLNAFGVLVLPKISIVLIFVVMAVVLIVRQWGLLGRPG